MRTHNPILRSVFGMALCSVSLFIAPGSRAAAAESAQAAPANTDDKIYYCPEGIESYLPGDYYACRAKYHFQRNHAGQAIDMLQEAAYWANKDAAYALGLLYFNGDASGIPVNRPLGLAWLQLSAERKNPQFVREYAIARAHCTPDEIRQATTLWNSLKPKYGDQVAGVRAMRRFNHNIQDMDMAANSGGITYIRGFSPVPEPAFVVDNWLRDRAAKVFDGLQGTVTVGALQPIFLGAVKGTPPATTSSQTTP